MRPIGTERDLDHLRRQAWAWAVLSTWATTGRLDLLADGAPRPLDALPGDPRALAITAPILAHLGLLVRHDDEGGVRWSLSATGRALHAQGALDLQGAAGDLDHLARLDEVLAEGGPVRDRDGTSRGSQGGVRAHDPEGSRRFMDLLWRRSERPSEETARVLAQKLPPGAALDLGGGHGRYGAALADRGFQVTLLDVPLIVDLARQRYGEALAYRAGDFFEVELGGPYDLVLLSNIVHGLSPDELRRLLPRLRGALRPGGLLVLKDMFLDDTGAGPEPAVLFGLVMLLYTDGGRSHGVSELQPLLAEAGFPHLEHVGLRDLGFSLLVAR